MTVTPSSPVVGIFKDRSMAEQAIDALHNAGFTSEQVRYSAPGTSGSILADLKSLFTGQNASGGNITNDLTDMGLSDEEAQYYANEYKNGNTILVVSASNRQQEALNILQEYGAYNARTSDSSPETTYSQQPADADQQIASDADQTPLQQTTTPEWATQQRISDVEDVLPHYDQQNEITSPAASTDAQSSQSDDSSKAQAEEPTQPLASTYSPPPVSSSDDAISDSPPPVSSSDDATYASQPTSSETAFEFQTAQPDAISSTAKTPDFILVPQDAQPDVTPSDTATSDSTFRTQAAQSDTAPSDTVTPDSPFETQAAQSDTAPFDTVASDSKLVSQDGSSDVTSYDAMTSDSTLESQVTSPDSDISDVETSSSTLQPSTSPATTASEQEDELQQLLAQLQDAQQQLQDARAQLQAAKEHETYIQTIRERERQLQTTRQQLQDIQAQLQTTMAELHETHQRISQYQ